MKGLIMQELISRDRFRYCPQCGARLDEQEKHNEKMVLVIDKPNECSECPCFYDYLRCQAEDAKVYGEKRPYNCPLKPMPKRKLALFDPNHCDMEEEIKIIHEINGYNRCIDEILGGK